VLAPIGNKSLDESQTLTFTATADDPDAGQSLSFSLTNGPAGATIDASTGAFSWTPTEAQGPGTYMFDVVVTDNGSPTRSDFETIQVTVNEVNQAPVANAGGPYVISAGNLLTLDGTASTDSDGHSIVSYQWDLTRAC